ncbi:hypothetical protein [Burkholderia gladioli]|uniref:hypothetical protein n=1 Tax=Burkholderia gladioli TaxID=28095 RepID=UPI001642DDD8|nr:hypothetical protein [Burkholderia gladioli]
MQTVAVLFARADSIYKALPGCDVWDIERDARRYGGSSPVVAHPPCRAWGRLAHLAKPRSDEKALALFAVERVRKLGGVLEHPAYSKLWREAGLPAPGSRDAFGGHTLPVNQHWWGHRAEKATWLYIVGCEPASLPEIPLSMAMPSHVVCSSKKRGEKGYRPKMQPAERERTPVDFARWLCEVARRAGDR